MSVTDGEVKAQHNWHRGSPALIVAQELRRPGFVVRPKICSYGVNLVCSSIFREVCPS
jgi:hypothetical protein